jgi:hypothetical protein
MCCTRVERKGAVALQEAAGGLQRYFLKNKSSPFPPRELPLPPHPGLLCCQQAMQTPVAREARSEEEVLQTPVMAGAANATGSAGAGCAGAQRAREYLGFL